jgi:hypothetical protein
VAGYTFGDTLFAGGLSMAKALSLKLDEPTYLAAEKIRKRLKVPRNTYLRKAVSHYNALYSRKLLEQEYRKTSRRLGASHLEYLKETELLEDLPDEQ